MIKKNRRKNPNTDYYYIGLLKEAIYNGDPFDLDSAITYYRQGHLCNDCGLGYNHCKCEYCDTCGYNNCLCDLLFTKKRFYNYEEDTDDFENEFRKPIRKKAIEIAIETLSNKQLDVLLSKLDTKMMSSQGIDDINIRVKKLIRDYFS